MMDCATARKLLSAFHDHELGRESECKVREHVEACLECGAALADFNALSRMVTHLRDPFVPPGVWFALESRLDNVARLHRAHSFHPARVRKRLLSIGTAACLLVMGASIGLIVYFTQSHGHEQRVAAGFRRFLEEFEHDPDRAQHLLLASYDGRAVDLDQAARLARYRPVAPADLPSGFSRTGTYLLEMPCCTCVETVYKDDTGQVLAVFEHADDQPVWFGDRPAIVARCNGKAIRMIQMDGHLAASWKRNGRHITVVGARGMEQVPQLMAILDRVEPPEGRRKRTTVAGSAN